MSLLVALSMYASREGYNDPVVQIIIGGVPKRELALTSTQK
jgi:hypothetical protein